MAIIEIPVNELTPFDLPRVCVMTGATDGVEFRKVKFQWYPRWVNVLILINVLVMAVVAQVTMKRCAGELPFTTEAWERWQKWKWGIGGSVLGLLVGIISGAVLMANDVMVGGLLFPLVLVQFIVVMVLARRAGPQVESIKDDLLRLKVPSDEVAQRFASHLKGS
jgi:hypothetical protein